MVGGFDRERFLLRTVAGVFIAQFTLYAIALVACINLSLKQLPRPACASFAERLQDTFEAALGRRWRYWVAAASLLLGAGIRTAEPRSAVRPWARRGLTSTAPERRAHHCSPRPGKG